MENDFVLDKAMVLAGATLLPVIIWYFQQQLTKKILLFGLLFFLVFSRGTLELIGIPSTIMRIILELLIIWIFSKSLFLKKNPGIVKFPGLFWILLFVVIALLSIILNELSVVSFFLFLRDYLMIALFFYGVLNSSLSIREQLVLQKLLIFLFIAQIAANIVKLVVFQHIVEPYIGTMANLGGSLTVVFALMGGAYTLGTYLITKKKRYILWTVGFIGFSIIGGKRATIIYFPFIYFFIFFIYQRKFETFRIRGVGQLIMLVVLSIAIFYSSIRLMPSLNKERDVGGSFDMEYALNYSESYLTTGAGAVEQIGRTEAPFYILNFLSDDNVYNFLLGYGAGHLIKSSFNTSLQDEGSQVELTNTLYGVGYGARTAFLQILLQTGVLGLICFLLWLFSVFRFTKKNSKPHISNFLSVRNYLFYMTCWLIFLIDFFTYSVTIVQISSVAIVFIWCIANYHSEKISLVR